MGIPSKPSYFQIEGPATACIIHGQLLGWDNCTCLSFAMGMDKSSINQVKLTGCDVREQTNDWAGGTTIEQNAAVAEAHGIHVEIHTGANVASPNYLARSLQAGRGVSLAGNTSVLGKGNVNHNVWVNNTWGGVLGTPAFAAVWDPWSSGPAGWAWSKVISFARALHPWGESDPRTLASMGINGVYCGIFPDTEPHVHLYNGAVKSSPFPDSATGRVGSSPTARTIRKGPSNDYAVVGTLAVGATFVSYQYLQVAPRIRWYGNHDANQWVLSTGLAGAGS
jgi:hypothetical protein